MFNGSLHQLWTNEIAWKKTSFKIRHPTKYNAQKPLIAQIAQNQIYLQLQLDYIQGSLASG